MMLERMRPLLLAAVGALALSPLLLPAQADAGQIGLGLSIQGAGRVEVVGGELSDGADRVCDRSGNRDDRVTVECPRVRSESILEAYLALAPVESAPGFTFVKWEGCADVATRDGREVCFMRSGPFSSSNYQVRAIFTEARTRVTDLQVTAGADQGRLSATFSHDGVSTLCSVAPTVAEAPCTSGASWVVPEGEHVVWVTSVNGSGQSGTSVASQSVWVTDTVLTGGPPPLTASRSATFSFTTRAGTSFECSLDGGAWRACASGRSGSDTVQTLADGEHTYRVRARHGAWFDPTPAQHLWNVDATAPTIGVGRPSVEGTRTTIEIGAVGAARYECRLTSTPADPADHDFTTCGSLAIYEGLGEGRHVFEARAFDAAGNVSAPASTTWDVDHRAPEVRLTGGPAQGSFSLAPTATFGVVTDADATLQCTLDGRDLPCDPTGVRQGRPGATLASPSVQLTGLAPGTHVLEVGAVDAAGNTATPVVRTWTVAESARTFAKKGTWTSVRTGSAYGGTALTTTQKGATLTRSVTGARQVALVVGGSSKAGTVAVYAGRTLLGTVKLSKAAGTKRLVALKALARPFTGAISVKVTSTGKPVRVEGLAVRTR